MDGLSSERMGNHLHSSLETWKQQLQKTNPQYSGLLGLQINGEKQVEHPTRNGYVYFRFRDNLSEVVLAFNDKVSPVYDLPVVVERRNNKWYVLGRDTDRYSNWGSSAPYLPKHGFQHSFNREEGTGGDVVLIYPDQFMPLLVYPSGTFGAGMLQVAPYVLQRDSDFIYVGNTGTPDLLPYRPTNSSAIMGLVYLDRETGNPGILINSGSSFSASITGTAGISPYIPYPSESSQEPLYAFRLVSGTQSLVWDNLYNVRQFIGGGQGGGGGVITGGYMDLTTNQVAAGIKRFSDNIQIGIEPPALNTTGTVSQASEGVGAGNVSWTWGTGTASFMTGVQARGSKASPLAVQAEDILFRWRGRGHDGSTYAATSVEIRGVATENHNPSGHGTRFDFYTTPTGTTTMVLAGSLNNSGFPSGGGGQLGVMIQDEGVPLATGTTLNFVGDNVDVSVSGTVARIFVTGTSGQVSTDGWNNSSHTWQFHSSDAPSYVVSINANVTGTIGVGMKTQLTHQSLTKNFIVTSISVTGSTSYLNMYGGTEFTLNVTGTITNPKYSYAKAPFGFSVDPNKWSVVVTNSSIQTQNTPTQNTWYNPGSVSINIPIGTWRVSWKGVLEADKNGTDPGAEATLSTANNSASDSDFTGKVQNVLTSYVDNRAIAMQIVQKVLVLTSKTTYYMNIRTTNASVAAIHFRNDAIPAIIKAECAYL